MSLHIQSKGANTDESSMVNKIHTNKYRNSVHGLQEYILFLSLGDYIFCDSVSI